MSAKIPLTQSNGLGDSSSNSSSYCSSISSSSSSSNSSRTSSSSNKIIKISCGNVILVMVVVR